jgi:putative copper export protein/methionine-rich copper-binding protein CopC
MMATLLVPAKALAHARLKRSQPAAGSQLTSPPQFVRLWFSEQPELSMTFASLSDSRGASFALSPAARETADQLGIAFHVLNVLPPGRYTLSWRTTASDGHPSSGKFTFVVLRGTTQVSGLAPQAASPRDSTSSAFSPETIAPAGKTADLDAGELDAASSVGNSIARALLFVGLLALVGAISFKLLILRGTRTVRVELKERMSQRAASLGTIAAAVVILVALLRLYLESQMMSAMPDMPGMRAMGARDMVMVTDWGFALRIQIAAAIAALIGFALAMRRIRGGWFVATAAALILAITPALSGHAAASPTFTSLMIAADWLHVLGGASWLGSLLCLMVIGVPVALTLDPLERWPSIASLVNAFSPVALVSAGVVVASGAFASWIHLQHLSALWQTTYGKTLLVKLLLVAITFAIGAYNFKRVQPRLLTEIGVSRLEKSAATELVVGFMILLVTGLLTGVSP